MTSKSSSKTAKQDTVTISPYQLRRHREQLAEWLKANGVEPCSVSTDHAIQVKGSTITYHAFDLNDDGRPHLNQATSEVVTVERTAHCAAPVPELTLTPSDIRGT